MQHEHEVIIFDICGTLYDCNTTAEFSKFISETRSDKMLLWLVSTKMGKIVNKLIKMTTGIELNRSVWLRALRGKSSLYLRNMSDEFVKNILNDKKIAPIHALLYEFGTNNVILVSASIEPVVRAISKVLKVERYIASELAYESGICSGQLSVDMLGNKHNKLGEMKIKKVITDNKSDLELCWMAENSIIVTRPRNVLYWQKRLNNIESIVVV